MRLIDYSCSCAFAISLTAHANFTTGEVKHPRSIDMNLVNAQQARRVLDRIVGYKISPILWAKVKKGLSAGRVQSVATRMICDREEEIQNFTPEEYWSIEAVLTEQKKNKDFVAKYYGENGKEKKLADAESKIASLKESIAALS